MKKLLLICSFLMSTCYAQKSVLLDSYFNNEVKNGVSWHYKWDETAMSGFSILGETFKRNGFSLATLKEAPNAANLQNHSVYIIVDPDNLKDSPTPNYMDDKSVAAVAAWVKAGGALVLFANDSANAELKHFNKLANAFGIHFNNQMINHVTNDVTREGGGVDTRNSELFATAKMVYMKDACSISIKDNAYALLKQKDDIIIAGSNYGKGFVIAIGDPWLYNEYVNGNLQKEFENDKGANDLVSWLKNKVAKSSSTKDLIGRWDITLDMNGTPAPSWLEVKLSGYKTLVGSFVATSGSARPVAEVKFENGKFHFEIPPQWENGTQNMRIEGEVTAAGIAGTLTDCNGKKFKWTGVKAPYLKRTAAPVWGKPINLFNGKDLAGWKASGENQWVVKNGILTSPKAGANLITEQKFNDFKLHVEFKYPKGGNSGIYLRGRYETQIEDSQKDAHPNSVLFGGVYGFLTANEMVTLGPDQWQTFDITLVGRMVTVVANGKRIISNQEIPGITGGALDSNEGEPGPIYLQGDHRPIEFRKIVLTPASNK